MAAEVVTAEQRDTLALGRLFAQLRAHLETRNSAGRVGQVLLGFGVACLARHSFCSATSNGRRSSSDSAGCSRSSSDSTSNSTTGICGGDCADGGGRGSRHGGGSFKHGERNSVRYGFGLFTCRANMTAVAGFVEEDRTSTTSRLLTRKETFLKTAHYSA